MNSQVSNSLNAILPPLDTHAHIAPTVTDHQLIQLGDSLIFAVTRALDEAEQVTRRNDPHLLWGLGTHPGLATEMEAYDAKRFRRLIPHLGLVGEVGLDRKIPVDTGLAVLEDELEAARAANRISSLHSTGRHAPIVELLRNDAIGTILHWFTGTPRQIEAVAAAGAYFSVNAAMRDTQIAAIPAERLLPETDFPFTRKAGSTKPGDIETLEQCVAQLLGLSRDGLRHMWYQNLKQLYLDSNSLALRDSVGLKGLLLSVWGHIRRSPRAA